MTTGGAIMLVLMWSGSMTTAPSIVGNQSLPSCVFQPAGCVKPLHSAERMPSARPKETEATLRGLAVGHVLEILAADRKMPRLQLIQRLPRPSSRIAYCTSSKRPSLRLKRVNLPSLSG